MKCPNCGGKGKYKNGFGKVDICYYCLGTGKVNDKGEQIRTNEEWFCGLSTETKARIMHLVYMAGYTDGYNGAETIPLRDVKEWLKQPHDEVGK